MAFKRTNCEELKTNLFRMIGKDWLLICCDDKENKRENMMTASWGGMGVLWNLPVCFLFVRPQRHTYSLLETEERFSVCVLPEEWRSAHKVCGSQSGRDVNKIISTGLTEIEISGVKALSESEYVFVLKQLYVDTLKKDNFLDQEQLLHYPQDDFHAMYVCKIEEVYVKE